MGFCMDGGAKPPPQPCAESKPMDDRHQPGVGPNQAVARRPWMRRLPAAIEGKGRAENYTARVHRRMPALSGGSVQPCSGFHRAKAPMNSCIRATVCALLFYCFLSIGAIAKERDNFSIRLANQTEAERKTEQQLQRIFVQYDLAPWTFTQSIVIDAREIPHSHPILTLHTRHLKDDELLLSTYIHEQLHWFAAKQGDKTAAAIRDLRLLHPNIPVGFPEGSSDIDGNYEHLIVIYLEFRAIQAILGELKATEVMKFWAEDHYTWLYKEILRNPEKVGKVLNAHDLLVNSKLN